MPLPRPDLLNPIPGSNPSGENLRYAPVYDKIKQARTEDGDTTPQGEWQRERKKADWPTVLKLAGDALATKSKDLMLASWLGEALTKREGISGLADALELQRGLLEQYWDSLYPEKDEDGDLGLRVMPVEFLATRSRDLLRTIPLTKSGNDWTVPAGAKLTDEQYKDFQAGNLYVNVHSAENKSGEIRGNLSPK